MNKRGEWMRILVFFDLPTLTKKNRHDATKFRNDLLKDGYDMLQWSVYSRLCHSLEVAERHKKDLEKMVPKEGQVRVMLITEKQFSRMEFLIGEPSFQENFHKGQQLLIF